MLFQTDNTSRPKVLKQMISCFNFFFGNKPSVGNVIVSISNKLQMLVLYYQWNYKRTNVQIFSILMIVILFIKTSFDAPPIDAHTHTHQKHCATATNCAVYITIEFVRKQCKCILSLSLSVQLTLIQLCTEWSEYQMCNLWWLNWANHCRWWNEQNPVKWDAWLKCVRQKKI